MRDLGVTQIRRCSGQQWFAGARLRGILNFDFEQELARTFTSTSLDSTIITLLLLLSSALVRFGVEHNKGYNVTSFESRSPNLGWRVSTFHIFRRRGRELRRIEEIARF